MRLYALPLILVAMLAVGGFVKSPSQSRSDASSILPDVIYDEVKDGNSWELFCEDLNDTSYTGMTALNTPAAAGDSLTHPDVWRLRDIGTVSSGTNNFLNGWLSLGAGITDATGPYVEAEPVNGGFLTLFRNASYPDSVASFRFQHSLGTAANGYMAVGMTSGDESHWDGSTDFRYEPPSGTFWEYDQGTATVQAWAGGALVETSETLTSPTLTTFMTVTIRCHYSGTISQQWCDIYVDGEYATRMSDAITEMIDDAVTVHPFMMVVNRASFALMGIQLDAFCLARTRP